jgi:hypothetical protein
VKSLLATRDLRQFANRACIYAELDSRLGARTRFYCAASLINRLFAQVLSVAAVRLWISGSTIEFLLRLGSYLEPINTARAASVHRSQLPPHVIDHTMVSFEQAAVQSQIDQFRIAHPEDHALAISDLDYLINGSCSLHLTWMIAESLPVTYREAMCVVRQKLGRALSFSQRSDRESVGRALIAAIRLHNHQGTAPNSDPRSGLSLLLG